jgi:MscS family membrane protein
MLEKLYYGNTIPDYLAAAGIVLTALIVGKLLYWVIVNVFKSLAAKTKTRLDDIVVDMIEEPLVLAICIVGVWLASRRLALSLGVVGGLSHVLYFATTFTVAWLVVRLVDAIIAEYLVPLTEASASDLDDQLLPILRKGFRLAIWCIAIIVGANNAGYDIGAIVAGLGIGGLAFALAAKDSVQNLFGGFTIFMDKPFTVNDRVKIQGIDGTVVDIGIRSTRLRTLAGRIVTIPNAKFTDNAIENVSSEPNRKVVLALGLTYDTGAAGMRKGMELLSSIVSEHISTLDESKIGFGSFGDYALGLTCIYYIRSGEDIMGTQTEINLAILDQFDAAGLVMAFPTQTVYTIPPGAAASGTA